DADRAVPIGRCQTKPIGPERKGIDKAPFASLGSTQVLGAVLRVPGSDRTIFTCRDHQLSIGAEGHLLHGVRVPYDAETCGAGRHVGYDESLVVLSNGGEGPTIRRERDLGDVASVTP